MYVHWGIQYEKKNIRHIYMCASDAFDIFDVICILHAVCALYACRPACTGLRCGVSLGLGFRTPTELLRPHRLSLHLGRVSHDAPVCAYLANIGV